MQLTKNERKTLTLMLDNGKISDTEIATELNITKQAVGKIRKKLESTGIIKGYEVKIDYERIGIHAFAITTALLSQEGINSGDLQVEIKLLENPNIIKAFRVPSGDITHILIYGFENLDELTNYFHKRTDSNFLIKQIHVCSHIGFLKDNPNAFIKKLIEDSSSKKYKSQFTEIDKFKERISKN